ncbi:MAG: Dam family site-specific DNA-(adenine-N6)-methyltransferase [Cyanobacterium sp. T60_A2020_053]|nr:Dam family site-specific DNA-(adenine-N6)-methyltransferase [Cyanobacterium sp. T60_A2020_053]
MMTIIPPIKSQGIKTKLVPVIKNLIPKNYAGIWIEPFMGTGIVGFNLDIHNMILCDTNPHLINFYSSIQEGIINSDIVRTFLEYEGQKLLEIGENHYYKIRHRFNQKHSPLDFLFLNRSGFNGMIRFNKKGEFNIPFCRKPHRFARAYITKIVNQVEKVSNIIKSKNITFIHQSFETTINKFNTNSLIYCDPPYIDRNVDYYNSWNIIDEQKLFDCLSNINSSFILSTWHHNNYRKNEYIDKLWSKFNIITYDHFYFVGGKETNRNSITEAIITNYNTNFTDVSNLSGQEETNCNPYQQLEMFTNIV